MNLDIIKNPIIIAMFVAIIAFIIFYLYNKDKMIDKTYEENKTSYLKYIGCSILVGVVGYVVSKTLFVTKVNNDFSIKPENSEYHYVKKNNIREPPTDVFLDVMKF